MNRINLKTECPFHEHGTSCTANIRLFQNLPDYAQKELTAQATDTTFQKGETIASEGEEIQSVIIIRKGRIKTTRYDSSGEEYILDILHEEQAIWHDMFLHDHRYHYSIIAMTDVAVCQISREAFMKVLKKHPDTALSLISMLSTELHDAKEKVMLLSIRNPYIRLAGFLLDKDRTCTNHLIQMKLDDIAASIGLRPETISRNLSRLEKEQYIKRSGQGKIKVINRTGLQELYDNLENI